MRGWAKPASDSEEQKRDRTEQAVTDAINASQSMRNLPINVYAKGSYANNTNVKRDSDVDVGVEYTGFHYLEFEGDLEGLTREEAHRRTGNFPPLADAEFYAPAAFKRDIEEALVAAFGRSAVTRHNKALTVREASSRLSADVVPCFSLRRYDHLGTPLFRPSGHRGVQIFPDQGQPIENWPQQQYDNGVERNRATGKRYKAMVRALKNLENELCDKGLINEAPGYFAECLVYNVPNSDFCHNMFRDDMRAVLAHIFNETLSTGSWNEFVEVNERKYLFSDESKWTVADAHKLAAEGRTYMAFE